MTFPLFAAFTSDLFHHFDMEEKVMFPTFEEKTGMTGGPTQMMRMEQALEQLMYLSYKTEFGNR